MHEDASPRCHKPVRRIFRNVDYSFNMPFEGLLRTLSRNRTAALIGAILFCCTGLRGQVSNASDCRVDSARQCVVAVLRDEKGIITAPTRARRDALKWVVPITGATALAIAQDASAAQAIGRDPNCERAFRRVSDISLYTGIRAAEVTRPY